MATIHDLDKRTGENMGEQTLSWIGDGEGRTNPELNLKLGLSNSYSIDQAEKNLINGGSTTPDARINFNTRQTSKPRLDLRVPKQKEDLRRLKRMMSNRVSSEKYRKKKMLYMDHLENQLRTLRNIAEGNRLRELRINQLKDTQDANSDESPQIDFLLKEQGRRRENEGQSSQIAKEATQMEIAVVAGMHESDGSDETCKPSAPNPYPYLAIYIKLVAFVAEILNKTLFLEMPTENETEIFMAWHLT
ncbi:unnamed protein product [Sphenostylis stenocarpa]|uniref:BZIP domain-containing protein n=1 Tax=Sphenostylis stenocarpa TaxID=92480 RepID=A0AA86SV29_9FABA|nr:unnamed protein product [Sphenostylis stenocarpa]